MTRATVVIPAYNAEKFIRYAIRSAQRQTENPDIIVVDDGSTDSTLSIAEELGACTLRLGRNTGAAHATNKGAALAMTRYVALLSADDLYLSDFKLERQADQMDATGADLSYCTQNFQGADPAHARPRLKALSWMMKSHPFAAVWLNNPIDGSSVMLRKTTVDRLGLYDESLGNFDPDGEAWMRWMKAGAKVALVDWPGTFYTHHEGQTSRKRLAWYTAIIKNRVRAFGL